MELIIKHIKTKKNLFCFNNTNVLIFESKDYKIKKEDESGSTMLNNIKISPFNEKYKKY